MTQTMETEFDEVDANMSNEAGCWEATNPPASNSSCETFSILWPSQQQLL